MVSLVNSTDPWIMKYVFYLYVISCCWNQKICTRKIITKSIIGLYKSLIIVMSPTLLFLTCLCLRTQIFFCFMSKMYCRYSSQQKYLKPEKFRHWPTDKPLFPPIPGLYFFLNFSAYTRVYNVIITKIGLIIGIDNFNNRLYAVLA